MSQRKPEKAKSKSGQIKLTLSKETLRDLTSKRDNVKGGVKGVGTQGCGSRDGQGCESDVCM